VLDDQAPQHPPREGRILNAGIPKLNGVLETALYVEELSRSAAFYRSLFGFDEILSIDRLCALSVEGRQVLLLFKKGGSADLPISAHDGSGQAHLAFAIPADALDAWEARLRQHGVAFEEKKIWERGGISLYFRDPDGHLLELATPGIWSIY
jgi:catechol 2,3-dioxygenase-like lactoylglutathione lyase family enzyme